MKRNCDIWRLFFVVSVALFVCHPLLAEEKTMLVVWSKDSAKVAYALDEKPKISFTDTTLIISVKDAEVSYPLEDMLRFTYEDNTSMAITNLQTDKSIFKLDGEFLLFPALKANSTVSVYSLSGTLVFKKTVRQNGEYAFALSSLNSGVYMVNVNGLTYKIVKR